MESITGLRSSIFITKISNAMVTAIRINKNPNRLIPFSNAVAKGRADKEDAILSTSVYLVV
jgi:hypothetical protein